jgi:hypothetical protein
MTISEINTKITQLLGIGTGADQYPAAQRLIDVNNAYHKVASMIFDSQDESDFDDPNYTDFPILTTSLVADQRDYSIPSSEKVVSIKNVSISYDGTNFYKAVPVDWGETILPTATAGSAAETEIDSNFNKTNPRYDYKYNSLFLYPRADATDVANGGKIIIEWTREVDPFTSGQVTTGTREPGFDTAFHVLLAYYPAIEWAIAKGKQSLVNNLLPMTQDLEARLRRQYGKKVRDRRLQMTSMDKNYK